MHDFRTDRRFSAALCAVEAALESYAENGVPDALALRGRGEGENNLQGHRHTLVPLAVAFLIENSSMLSLIRSNTDLNHSMNQHSSEARASFWDNVRLSMRDFIEKYDQSVISSEMSTGIPQRICDARRYMSDRWGGIQTTGGAGNTVVKRTLKLVAHTFYNDNMQ